MVDMMVFTTLLLAHHWITGGIHTSNTILRTEFSAVVVVRLFSVSSVITAFLEGLCLPWNLRRKPWPTWGCAPWGEKNCILRLHL